jgi:hypothetical protein
MDNESLRKLIKHLMELNHFNPDEKLPCIVVFRNFSLYDYIDDTGDNLTDTICLVDESTITRLSGRSFPGCEYGTPKRYHIASGFYPSVYRKDVHDGYHVLTADRSLTLWRHPDVAHYIYPDIYNKFSGGAPDTPGHICVFGSASPQSHDWAVAYDWIYSYRRHNSTFGLVVFEYEDVANPRSAYRIGSMIEGAKELTQCITSIASVGEKNKELLIFCNKSGWDPTSDKDICFGRAMFNASVDLQRSHALRDTGVLYVDS